MELLEDVLGRESFKATVRSSLSAGDTSSVPKPFELLWKLGISGLITTNLDTFASRAFPIVRGSAALNQASGINAAQAAHLLKTSTSSFLVSMHGSLADASSWIMTRRSFRSLLQNAGYKSFVQTLLLAKTVVFIGSSADDPAIEFHLTAMSEAGLDLGEHFWITSRRDKSTDVWAEQHGLRVIRYDAGQDKSHSELTELLLDLVKFVPTEHADAPPVVDKYSSESPDFPEPSKLRAMPVEQLRELLNQRASFLLYAPNGGGVTAFDDFCKRYGRAINDAGYVSLDPGENSLFGYELEESLAEGGFGRVFRARRVADGAVLAIKLVKNEVRARPELLHAFRRGVQAMKILAQHDVKGMVPYIDAKELPAYAAMEFVDGPNLEQAIEQRLLEQWPEILRVAIQLAETVRRAHTLPERVLHRDIRPANVMLRSAWSGSPPEVVVLDFDLCWYRDAIGASIVNQSALNGYLAPEQLVPRNGVSSRSTLVDSFGFGMTLYFMCTKRTPVYGAQNHAAWQSELFGLIEARKCGPWGSLPRRIARLVLRATRDAQAERLDLAAIIAELRRLLEAANDPASVSSVELIAEELAFQTSAMRSYVWNSDSLKATVKTLAGIELELGIDELYDRVTLQMKWESVGQENRRKLAKYLPKTRDQVCSGLRTAGWSVRRGDITSYGLIISADIAAGTLGKDLRAAARSLETACEAIAFD